MAAAVRMEDAPVGAGGVGGSGPDAAPDRDGTATGPAGARADSADRSDPGTDSGAGGSAPPEASSAAGLGRVAALLRDEPRTFGFFQAVRLLERLDPDAEPVGGFAEPSSEVARFGVPPTLAFPTGEIRSLSLGDEGPSSMVVNFMGTVGPQGVLPHEYTRQVAERRRAKDGALGDFLDLFHHRVLSLFYQAWRRYRFELDWEDRARGRTDRPDRLTGHLLDLVGLDPEEGPPGEELTGELLAGYAALFGPQQRSAAALEQLLGDHFGVPAEVEQFVGGWYRLESADQCVVGEEVTSSRLGAGAVVGDEVWDQQARVRIRLGPMGRARFDDFLPSGDAHEKLRALVRLFTHDQFEVELQLVLEREEVPGCVLGGEEEGQPLGWSTWIRSRPFDRHADDTILML
jgi:type VI secretion system protein ImpH